IFRPETSILNPRSSILQSSPRATICILTYGEYLAFFRRCFDSILANSPLQEIELRLGFNDALESVTYAKERLGGGNGHVERVIVTGEVERFSLVGPGGMKVGM